MTNRDRIADLQADIDVLQTERFKRLLQLPSFSAIYKDEYKVAANLQEVFNGMINELKSQIKYLETQNGDDTYVSSEE